jgi:hypothetical protein
VREPVAFIPIVTTLIAIPFALLVLARWRSRRSGPHLVWWAAGIALYGVGTLTESLTTLLGWHEPIFRAWYISGALLGAAPLAQGTVYLLFARRTANRMAAGLLTFTAVAAFFVLIAPLDYSAVEPYRLTGHIIQWRWVRFFSPFINAYAAIFLIGGAIVSALRFRGDPSTRHRVIGNTLIAVGAILPGIGGTATRMGHTEVLYVTELLGLLLILAGYLANVRPRDRTGGEGVGSDLSPASAPTG